jgi:cell division protein FtsB
MDELLENTQEQKSWFQKTFDISALKFFVALIAVVIAGIYIGNLLFGSNSLEVYMQLEEYEYELKTKIYNLKEQNAALQKEFFELRELDIDYNKRDE